MLFPDSWSPAVPEDDDDEDVDEVVGVKVVSGGCVDVTNSVVVCPPLVVGVTVLTDVKTDCEVDEVDGVEVDEGVVLVEELVED